MRRKDAASRHLGSPAIYGCERPQRFRVEDRRHGLAILVRSQQPANQLGHGQARTQPRAHDQGVVVVVEDARQRLTRIHFLDVVLRQRKRRGLHDLGREEGLERLRRGQGDEPRPGAAGSRADEQGRSGVVQRPGDHQQPPEGALVAAHRSRRQQRGNRRVVEENRVGYGSARHRCPRHARRPPRAEPR